MAWLVALYVVVGLGTWHGFHAAVKPSDWVAAKTFLLGSTWPIWWVSCAIQRLVKG